MFGFFEPYSLGPSLGAPSTSALVPANTGEYETEHDARVADTEDDSKE